ncbi:hypothetical protein AJ80_04914 [Polytolypa hystricis UAMH7299]|uniref:Malate/L-lactate dehydrogenase n=1 Tax=Polytolypa hystricis (strain UAMH7299) TaxID=1447883 RepID=A0A2B7Y8S2_POLH7|nr:hypothetical protein AJ80_04914 [Polytolypa hystricis UAMH7299]
MSSPPSSTPTPPPNDTLLVSSISAQTFTHALLTAHSVPSTHATIIAHCLVSADLRGVDSHGINRLPSYLSRVRTGSLNPLSTPTLTQITPAIARVNGHNGFGFVSAHLGMQTAITMASTMGIGMVSIHASNHFGMSASFIQQALDANMLSLVFTNSSPAMPVWGGKEKILGVSPIAAGAPASEGNVPFILDIAPSVVARGKVHKAARRGEEIPRGWAVDKEGRETTDPVKALDGGSMVPMGGPKGVGLAIMMDVFSGVFSGSAFAGDVVGPYDTENPREADVGHFMVAMRPDLWMDMEEFKKRLEVLYQRVVGSEKVEGVERVYFPGEIEWEMEKRRKVEGIPYTRGEIEMLNREADKVGVAYIEVL